jgi:hypothetical protein
MAYLDKGANQITFSFANPQDFTGGQRIHVQYKWKEYGGADWTIDKAHDEYISTSPVTFTINVGGTKVPRTESVLIEVIEPPAPDAMAPAAINNLVVAYADATQVDLTWTATGDDGGAGRASSYDLRYSTSFINDANWGSATQVTGEPTPKGGGRRRGPHGDGAEPQHDPLLRHQGD